MESDAKLGLLAGVVAVLVVAVVYFQKEPDGSMPALPVETAAVSGAAPTVPPAAVLVPSR